MRPRAVRRDDDAGYSPERVLSLTEGISSMVFGVKFGNQS